MRNDDGKFKKKQKDGCNANTIQIHKNNNILPLRLMVMVVHCHYNVSKKLCMY